jgi:MoxR-like ATPase
MGKTVFAKTFAKLLDLSFARIQFTNDLMPSDLVGVQVFNPETKKFNLIHGPIFHQFILADELNRGTPKTQSALLEAMEERQVTLDGITQELPSPFFVVAMKREGLQKAPYETASQFGKCCQEKLPSQQILLMMKLGII